MPGDALTGCPLFLDIPPKALSALLGCLHAAEKKYARREILIHMGETSRQFGILLTGRLYIIKEDFLGNSVLVAQISPGELFGEAFACGEAAFTVTVMAEEDSRVLWLEYPCILLPCTKGCECHYQIAANLNRILARRNIFLTSRVEHLSRRTLRGKILSYLEELSLQQGSRSITVPLDRQSMADYLGADRSALSAVLSGMAREGLIAYRKNHFTLL